MKHTAHQHRSQVVPCVYRTLIASAALALPLFAAAQAHAQAPLAVDPAAANRPGLMTAANGTPIVNIAAPDSAGISHNRFTEYNVNTAGLVLNNSATAIDTQLAGQIAGNGQLGGRSASIILNQVSGGNASMLAGATEVAGPNARVIVANPNGISVNGGRFINANRVSLVAGTAEFGENGNIEHFQTRNGRIAIDGAGLDARNVDQLDLVSRSLKVNAVLHARKLVAVAQEGNAQIEKPGVHQFSSTTIGKLPEVAIDVSKLGSMHASAITTYGTSAGVGVNVAGKVEALTGGIEMSSNGQVKVLEGGRLGARTISLDGTLDNAGTITGGTLVARQAAVNSGAIDVESARFIGATTNAGSIHAGNSLDAMESVVNDGTMRGVESVTVMGGLHNGRDGDISTDGKFTAMGAVGNSGRVHADRDMVIMGALINEKDGHVSSYGKITRMGAVVNAGEVVQYKKRPAASDNAVQAAAKPDTSEAERIVADKPANPGVIASVESKPVITSAAPILANKPTEPVATSPMTVAPVQSAMEFPWVMANAAPVFAPWTTFVPSRPVIVPPMAFAPVQPASASLLPFAPARPVSYSPFGMMWTPPVFDRSGMFNPFFAPRV
ncbi:filamentous hemagglutinin N-terminal domain-containing protein [Burkholderia territorii]|uniref:filamentous hemagglutinin N-terminal domain-containing protein n=1 Tax=Burkholderia territorii TaxID=1503055 RepID=UPI0007B913D6|nr:filamentous hemagglutinin N-terminal domain-containing protein [Burkholderia territorii]